MSDPIKIIQISDIHLFEDQSKSLLGVNTNHSFDELVSLVKSNTKADLILLLGDLSQDASPESYRRLAARLESLNTPIYCVPGNHDSPEIMQKIFPLGPISNEKQILFDHWQLILLNSNKPNSVEGQLVPSELLFLQKCLDQYPDRKAVICLHHHPIPVGSTWLDHIGLWNANELWDVLKNYSYVDTILFGHIHQVHEGKKNGVRYFSSPSTCIQFKTNSNDFSLDKVGPGYRLVELYSNGEIKTSVKRVDHYVGTFYPNAKGY